MLYRVPPRPLRVTREKRNNTLHSQLAGFNEPPPTQVLAPGHDQDLFDPRFSVANLQLDGGDGGAPRRQQVTRRRRNHQQNQNQFNNAAGLKLLVVGLNECYARAAFQFLVPLEVSARYFVGTAFTDLSLF